MSPYRRFKFPWRSGNHFTTLVDSVTFFPRMLDAIETAEHYILLEMYLVSSGQVADRFIAAIRAAAARGVSGRKLLMRYPARHALSPIINSLGFDLNRIFNELPIVALILTLTEAGSLLIEALARSNDQQLAGAIIFFLTGSIVTINFVTDIALAIVDPRIRRSILG